jgi:chromosome partitioning protein
MFDSLFTVAVVEDVLEFCKILFQSTRTAGIVAVVEFFLIIGLIWLRTSKRFEVWRKDEQIKILKENLTAVEDTLRAEMRRHSGEAAQRLTDQVELAEQRTRAELGQEVQRLRELRDRERRQYDEELSKHSATQVSEREKLIEEYKQQLEHQESASAELQSDLAIAQGELTELQNRFSELDKIDSWVWLRESRAVVPPFVSPRRRNCRLVSFLNFKGGVGKTTLTANLGAALATGVTGYKFRVLLVDLDFQGSLSNACVSNEFLNDRRTNGNTSTCLLSADSNRDASEILRPLITPLQGAGETGSVIVAFETLTQRDFTQQAKFAIENVETRFDFRELFHSDFIEQNFDFVFFDCPPRLSTSAINATLCSDNIVISTSMVPQDIDAVPRVLRTLHRFATETEYLDGELLGVIGNRTYRARSRSDLTKNEKRAEEQLVKFLKDYGYPEEKLFDALVPNSSLVAGAPEGGVALGTLPAGHDLYGDVAFEFLRRMQRLQTPQTQPT